MSENCITFVIQTNHKQLKTKDMNTSFPTHPIEINKMFKGTGLYVLNPELEPNVYMIKIHASKVKQKDDLQKAFDKIKDRAYQNGFQIELNYRNSIKINSDFRFHGSYYQIYFNVL